ncbi:TonB-dependent receptor plug domain-containing protein [Sphingomonas sp. 7/4-4]|uniref:TonB-dependent receptor plug domain-containing protein n=1 Tax=Sphingomonas sp. 7/4-4 TaxID=3018446 RepID=UPI0022F392C0|nr:TonB-dependent receptor plug domain-containing protein [Sphingomonas sp. 7/4-4]WBY08497.1 TonB-dependent receptor plug domain-containing protein [Sphingomonas sp. 7/4-4]
MTNPRRQADLASFSSMAALALASLMALPAAAQTAGSGVATVQETPAQSEATDEDELVVTGTRIIRDGFQAPTPLTVLTRDDINNTSPTNNIADFVNQLPQLAGSTKPANSRLNLSNGSAGINALSLRNLGEGRTLVLLDGRRSVGSTIYGWVDINTIPQGLVDRVEVVTGGASAAYGSDAVGGVVNFVLNKKLEGLRVTAESGVTTYGDGFNYSGSISGGKSFAGGAATSCSTRRRRTRTVSSISTRSIAGGTTPAMCGSRIRTGRPMPRRRAISRPCVRSARRTRPPAD